jgi:two-component sensor histidine kinase
MPHDKASAKAGLGTTIVEALANQLNAHVRLTDAHPGTIVSVTHSQISAVEGEPEERLAV